MIRVYLFVCWLLDLLWPRITVERVAVLVKGDFYEVVGRPDDVLPGERYDKIVKVRFFNFLGFGFFPRFEDD